jgi:hypothetical protein
VAETKFNNPVLWSGSKVMSAGEKVQNAKTVSVYFLSVL